MRRFAPLLALVTSCGPDPEPADCHGGPDFSVLIRAPDGPLPPETVVKLYYGGRAPDDVSQFVDDRAFVDHLHF